MFKQLQQLWRNLSHEPKLRRNQCKTNPDHLVSDWDGRYDAFACLVCNTWTHPHCKCTDPNECGFRHPRPERPSDAGHVLVS